MRIQHNIMAMNAYRNYNTNTKALSGNLEKLSSGYKINRAGDDAAGLAISEKMRAQITGLDAAQKNVKDGISLVKTAEGAMQEIQDMLNRMDYLATQSANGTYDNEVDRFNLQKEVSALKDEINRIADSANFNGIKLLDGSLAKEQTVDKIEVAGNAKTYKSVGSKASYQSAGDLSAYGKTGTLAADGDVLTFTVGFDDGTSTSVEFKVDRSEGTGKNKLTSLDGETVYAAKLANDGVVTLADLTGAIETALKATDLSKEFTIAKAADNKTITLTALENGSGGRAVVSFDITAKAADGTAKVFNEDTTKTAAADAVKLSVLTTSGKDDGIEIKASELTEYDGTNYDDAVFTINGNKFVILSNKQDGMTTGTANAEYLRAVEGLGSDVTVLVGGIGGLKAPTDPTTAIDPADTDVANTNFAQNIKKIAEVTGLNVTDAIAEATATGAGVGEGIRLSLSHKTVEGKGLTLQIGDTSDSFNQMKVQVGDMHVDAMGKGKTTIDGKDINVTKTIKDIDIGTQEGAQEAIAVIRNAINYVSGIRGDLGAVQNRLEHTGNNLSVMAENIQDAESTIRDTDVANEMMSYVKNNILVQSAQAMLAQANQVPQGVLQLLG